MPAWVIWMIAAGALAVGEIFSLSFFLGPVAVAAVLAAVAALAGAGAANALFSLESATWNGIESLELRLQDVRPS